MSTRPSVAIYAHHMGWEAVRIIICTCLMFIDIFESNKRIFKYLENNPQGKGGQVDTRY